MAAVMDKQDADTLAHNIKSAIGDIIKRHGERAPGSPGERALQEQLRKELEAAGFQPRLETFPVAQKAFMAMPGVCTLLALCSLPLYWIAPMLSPLPVMLALFVFVNELVFYRHVLSPFFPKRLSANVSASLPPTGKPTKRILFVGHADAAYEWNYHRCFPRIFPVFIVVLLVSILYILITTLAAAFTGGVYTGEIFWQWLGLSHVFTLPGMFIGLTFTNFKKSAPGAADNLSGSLCVTELVKWMKHKGLAFEHTEVVALVTGSEEAGLVGARAYIAAHKEEMRSLPTTVIAVDTLAELDHLALYTKDLNGRVAHDPATCALVREAGRDCGLNLRDATVTVGSSDGTAFTQAGIRTAALCAMNPKPAHYYHNRHDDIGVVEEACLSKGLQLLAAICSRYDRA